VTDFSILELLKLAIYYASYLYFPAAALLLWVIATRSLWSRVFAAIFLLALTVLAYARFIEPRILLTVEHDVALERCFPKAGAMRLAVFSDTHEGIFGNEIPIERIARRVAAAKPDAVLIAGDLTYFLDPARFDETFAALSDIDAPVYAVLGNHDDGFPGPDVSKPLAASLQRLGVRDIENDAVVQEVGGSPIEFAGLSDSWQGRQNMRVVLEPAPGPCILLTHNPKTVFKLPKGADVDLLVAGHTHGGQIYIPGATCAIVPFACAVTRYGLVDTEKAKVFVTSGTGMVGLPMRFLVPPRIDVLNVSYRACLDG
jgi:predicted MPP superfamily phosphohydrolase